MSDETDYSLSYRDKMAVEEHEKLSPRLVYEIIRRSGVEELQRPTKSLIYSGITAGLVISFSFFFKAVLTSLLPSDTVWTPLIANMGYTVGFIIVILGHMQLFTENTITTVVPLFRPFTWQKLGQVGRLWGIVFASNLIGTAIAAAFLLNAHLLNPEVKVALDAIATHVAHMSAMENIVRGIPAGILIASLVWMMPSSSSKLGLIFFMIYLIALGFHPCHRRLRRNGLFAVSRPSWHRRLSVQLFIAHGFRQYFGRHWRVYLAGIWPSQQ